MNKGLDEEEVSKELELLKVSHFMDSLDYVFLCYHLHICEWMDRKIWFKLHSMVVFIL